MMLIPIIVSKFMSAELFSQGANSVASKIWQNMVENEQELLILWPFDGI